jgi:hypothetical protein
LIRAGKWRGVLLACYSTPENYEHTNRKRRSSSIRNILLGIEQCAQWRCQSIAGHVNVFTGKEELTEHTHLIIRDADHKIVTRSGATGSRLRSDHLVY